MFHVYRNHAAALICPFIFFQCSFSPVFKHEHFSSHFSQELWSLEDWNLVHMWILGRCIMCTGIRLLLHIHPFISSFFFLSNFQILNIFVRLFSGTVRSRRLKLGTHMDNGWMYRVYRNQAAASYLSLFFSLSPMFKNLKFSSHFSQELWGQKFFSSPEMKAHKVSLKYTNGPPSVVVHTFKLEYLWS